MGGSCVVAPKLLPHPGVVVGRGAGLAVVISTGGIKVLTPGSAISGS